MGQDGLRVGGVARPVHGRQRGQARHTHPRPTRQAILEVTNGFFKLQMDFSSYKWIFQVISEF
jgi:hypothetical protein